MKSIGCAILMLAHGLVIPLHPAYARSGWVNNQGCYCGTYPTYPVDYIARGTGTEAERNAAWDQMSYWNRYATIYTPIVDTGLGAPDNGTNEVNTFISTSDAATIYGYTMSSLLYGVAIIWPDDHFGDFNECNAFDPIGCDDFTETDILVNAAFGPGWTTDPNDYSGPALVQATVLHEIGHTWGAHHVFTLPAFGDTYSTMNYVNDDAGRFVTRMDANTIRAAYPDQVQDVTDVGIFPFVFGNDQYAETYALISPTTVQAGEDITIANVLIQNIGNTVAADTVVSFYLSTDQTITAGDIPIGTAGFGDLVVDAQSDFAVTLQTPDKGVADGDYYIGAIVTVAGGADDIAINDRFIIGRPERTVVTVGTGCGVQNSGFESGTPNSFWTETSTTYGTPLCTTYYCGGGEPYAGNWFAWFGGVASDESGALEQRVTIPGTVQYVNFYLKIPNAATTGFLRVLIDDTQLFEATQASVQCYTDYTPVSIDISAYADDGSHVLRFESTTDAGSGALNFFVDDVCLSATAIGSDSCSSDRDNGGGGVCFIDTIRR